MEPTVKSAAITIRKWSAGGSQGGFSEEGTHVSHLLNLAEAFARETNGQNTQAEAYPTAEVGGSRTGQGFSRRWLVGPENRKKSWMEGKMGRGLVPERWAGAGLFSSVTAGTGHV